MRLLYSRFRVCSIETSAEGKDCKRFLQQTRLDVIGQLMRHLIETWKSTRELYLAMWKYITLNEANREIFEQIKRLLLKKSGKLGDIRSSAAVLNEQVNRFYLTGFTTVVLWRPK